MKNKLKLIIGIFIGLISNIIIFYSNRVLTRNLSAENYGDYSLAVTIIGFLSVIALLGLAYLAPREFIFYSKKKQNQYYWGFFYKSLQITFLISIIIVFIALLSSGIYLFLGNPYHEIMILICFLPIMCVFVFLNYYLISKHKVNLSLFFQMVLIPAVFLFFVLIAIRIHFFNQITAPIIFGLTWTAVLLFVAYLLRGPIIKTIKTKKKFETKKWLKMGFSLLINNLFNISVLPISFILLEILHSSEKEVGLYALLVNLLYPFKFANSIIVTIFTPNFLHYLYHMERKKIYKLILEITLYLFIISLVLFLIAIHFANPILNFFGNFYVRGAHFLKIFLFLNMLIIPFQIFPLLNLYLKNIKYFLHAFIIFTILNLIIGSILIKLYGIMGCIISSSLILFLFYIYNGLIFHYKGNVKE